MERKDYLVRILFVLFVFGYFLAATVEYVWTGETTQQQVVSKKKNAESNVKR